MFTLQIMKMLDDADQNNISDIVSWSYKDARRFSIHDKKAFKSKILPRYLNNIKFTSFTKQMRRWGFVAYQGAGRNIMSFSHPMFIRGDRERCKRIRTVQQQFSSRGARKDDRIISSSRRGEGGRAGAGAMTTTTNHQQVSASNHVPVDRRSEDQSRFLTTEADAALRLLRSSTLSTLSLLHPRQQQEQHHRQQGSSYSAAPPFPFLSLLPALGGSCPFLLHAVTSDTSSHLLNHADEQENLLARTLSRAEASYHSSLVDSSSPSFQQAAAGRNTLLLLQNNVVVAHQQAACYNAAAIVEELEIISRRAAVERMRRTRLLLPSERNAVDQLLQLHANSHVHYRLHY